MRRLLTGLALLLAAASLHSGDLTTTSASDALLPLLDSALQQVGKTAEDIRFDQDEMATWGGDRWRLTCFTLFHRHPLKLLRHGEVNLEALTDDVTDITSLVTRAARLIDHPISRSLIGDQLSSYLIYPDSVPVPSITGSKNVLVGAQYRALRRRIDLIYRIADDDESFFKRGLKPVDKGKYRQGLYEYFVEDEPEYHDLVYELADKIDFNRMIAGAQDIAEAARRAVDSVELLSFPAFKVEIKTRKGLIVVGTSGDDTYDYLAPPLIIFDGGGNDVYRLAGYPDKYPLTVIIDVAGNDRYISNDSTKPGIGGAVIGMSVLIDLSGDDYYQAVNLAQGAGLFGIGAVMDLQGNDVYAARTFSQGAAAFGIGILADSSGNDSLFCLSSSQGFGYTRGCGLLVNYEGDDRYVADDADIVNPSPQTAEHNASLAQGVGFGKRADYIDGHSWAGGVGILCDGTGNDRYSAGLFAQGCAYWFAVGMLLDGGGDDDYSGVWYVQGSGAHFGVGYLDDFGGNDSYTATHNMAAGAGHDFTVGCLNERGGDDTYTVPNLSLGGGNANGIGLFLDHAGDDVYNTQAGVTLGRANASAAGARRFLHVMGIFVDGGGNDTYREAYAGNRTRWIGPASDADHPSTFEIGVGIDR
ncbi:MAG TPA: hypothetical protein VMY05_06715 [Acidobacteriota bacterium]|nr:hypothetical protein [Acidobacteriota bacterium]